MKLGFSNITNPLSQRNIQSLSSEGREKLAVYLYAIFTLLAISFFGFFAIRPATATISNLQKQLRDSREVLAALKTKLSALESLDRSYQAIQADLPIIFDAVPKTSQVATLTRQFESIAKNNNLNAANIQFGTFEFFPAVSNSRELYTYSFTLDMAGDERDINDFISDIISFDRILSIDRISTGRNPNGGFQTSIAGTAYFYKGE